MAYIYILWLILTQILALVAKSKAKVPAVIVFGDSSVDSGNNNQIPTIARSNFKPYGRDFLGGHPTGRFSNGRIAPDFISEAFGLKPTIPAYLDPMYNITDFATGVCFASAGTGYDNATSDVLVSINMHFPMHTTFIKFCMLGTRSNIILSPFHAWLIFYFLDLTIVTSFNSLFHD